MTYLIDTHILIWYAENDSKLSQNVLNIISNLENQIYVSHASLWEITIKKGLGKLYYPDSILQMAYFLNLNLFSILDFEFSHYNKYLELPLYHNDPFDRMLISQAQSENFTIITQDEKFRNYDVSIQWN
jgi:PIN domain nuclease of toxin-antitoxin system